MRTAVRTRLTELHAEDGSRFVDELVLGGVTRVDMAVINGSLSGFELKSERDDLRRLPVQVEVYSRVLDYATLVVAARHHAHAVDALPSWWGVFVAHMGAEGVELEEARPAALNPSVDPTALVRLLWRDEILAELTRLQLDRGLRSKPWAVLAGQLIRNTDLDELRRLVREQLKAREGWRVAR